MEINSEIGKLKQVILHRPELSLERLTPENCRDFLFDDVLWIKKAAEEHQYFEQVLTDHGVKVYLLRQLLIETLENKTARKWLMQKTLNHLYHDSSLMHELSDYFSSMSATQLATHLIGGITWEECELKAKGLVSQTLFPDDFILAPLPNHLFTRDTSCWIGNGVSINPMHWPARQRETLNLAVIYKFHPLFKKASFETWYDGSDMEAHLPTVEGGDVLVLSKDCIAIGVSERSTPEAIETLAKRLFAKEDKQQIIAIEIPKERASMHLDTVMTMLDDHSFCIAFPCETIRAWNLRPNDDGSLNVRKEKNVFNAIGKAIGREKLRLITLGGDDFTEKREQWSDASNLLAISPGVVIGYERNVYTNKKLFNEGFDVISIPGSELGRGRGGARCMSCPIEREPFLF